VELFQAALNRFSLGTFVKAEPVPYGLFGQNVFLTSTEGEFVLRGAPHFAWQFPTEQFFVQLLHERTQASVPWPYLIDPAKDIFGWSYAVMPRMPGLQLADIEVKSALSEEDRRGIARAMAENLALMQKLVWPIPGRYDTGINTVRPFELRQELAWPFPIEDDELARMVPPTTVTNSERIVARIRHLLACSRKYNNRTTVSDIEWVEGLIADAENALVGFFQPCFVMEDYKEQNVVVQNVDGIWQVSGVFDFMEAHYGDGEADLSRTVAMYLDEDPELASEFVCAYVSKKRPRPGFAERFPVYMLADRAIIWEYCQRNGSVPWDEDWSFRDWASRYTSCFSMLQV